MGLFLTKPAVLGMYHHFFGAKKAPKLLEHKPDTANLVWHTSLDEAKKNAIANKGNILIYFLAEWCIPCHVMAKELFPQKEFQELVEKNKLSLLYVDLTELMEESNEIAMQYEIEGLPVMILTDQKAVEIDRIIGFRNKEDTIRKIEKILR